MGSLGGARHDAPVIGPDRPAEAPDAVRTVRSVKAQLREQVLGRRAREGMHPDDEQRITDRLLALVAAREPRAVAAHLGMAGEPGTHGFVRSCAAPVWLPVLRADRTMGWALYTSDADLAPHSWGMLQPAGPGLDELPDEIDLIVMPALAVDGHGYRLGRGGGYYDKAMAMLPEPRPTVVAVIPDGDVLDAVPHEPHDIRVDAIVTPTQTVWCTPTS